MEIECEFCGNVRFLNPLDVKLIDSSGHETEVPKCDKCKEYKQAIIGEKAFAWMCGCDCKKCKKK